jgi:transcriptional regulator GlxA family with amidase domain
MWFEQREACDTITKISLIMMITRRKFVTSGLALTAGAAFSSPLIAKMNHELKPAQTMTNNVGILIFDDVEVLDFAGPFEVFSVTAQPDFKPFNAFTLSHDGKPITAVNGLKVVPNYSIENHPKIDILIIAGGQGTRKLLNDPKLLKWVERIHATTQITMSICTGAIVLGKIGLLEGKPFCTHHQVYDYMTEIVPTGLPQKDKRFVQSGERLFTSGGISAGIDLSFHIVERLLSKDTALDTAHYMEYDLKQP